MREVYLALKARREAGGKCGSQGEEGEGCFDAGVFCGGEEGWVAGDFVSFDF